MQRRKGHQKERQEERQKERQERFQQEQFPSEHQCHSQAGH